MSRWRRSPERRYDVVAADWRPPHFSKKEEGDKVGGGMAYCFDPAGDLGHKKGMVAPMNRRTFLGTVGAVGLFLSTRGWAKVSPGEKLNLGIIGVAGRGAANLQEVSGENIVALCDVDDKNLEAAAHKFPGARTYNDFRWLLDQKDIDAVVISTPDHTHAVATMMAIKSGRHVYCEKPLAHTVSECRALTEAARKKGVVTQLGNQNHSGANYRRVADLIRSGVIGKVAEVHVWAAASGGGMELPTDSPPVPAPLHYDLWLGPLEARPYSPEWVPTKWRNWWAFGGGALADFGCHYMDLPFWALDLKYPLSAEVVDGPVVHPESTPPWLVLRYAFPKRGDNPPVRLTWYHGGRKPEMLGSLSTEDLGKRYPSGVLFIGEKGQLIADYESYVLLPERDYKNYVPPPLPVLEMIGHYKEWIQAIKLGGKTGCNFDYSGPLSETVLLGNVAYRCGGRVDFDAVKARALHSPQAEQLIRYHYRAGWSL